MIPRPKSFNIKNCPICNCLLNVQYVNGHTVLYKCPTTYTSMVANLPHYVIQVMDGKIEQRSIIPPYTLTSEVGSGRTSIYNTEHKGEGNGFIMNVPTILPTNDPEKLAQRIKTLILFS